MKATTSPFMPPFMLKAAPGSAAPNGSAATMPSAAHADPKVRHIGVSGRKDLAALNREAAANLRRLAATSPKAERAALEAWARHLDGLARELMALRRARSAS
jgi:hypothetical protein